MHRSVPSLAVLLLSASMLAGCVTPVPEHVPLNAQARAGLSSTEVVLPVAQSEIYIDVPASNVSGRTGGGLIPALIDAGIDSAHASKAAKDIAPLRNALVDFNFDQTLSDSFKAATKADGVHLDSVRVIKDPSQDSLDHSVTGAKSGVVLVATTNYHLADDGGSLWIEVHAALYRAGAAPNGDPHASAPANAIYRNTLWFTANVPHTSTKRDENIAAWSADNGAVMRADLKRGAAKISELIMADLRGEDANAGMTSDSDGSLERKADGTAVFRGGGN